MGVAWVRRVIARIYRTKRNRPDRLTGMAEEVGKEIVCETDHTKIESVISRFRRK
jgi:hypothetical protein